MSLIFIIISSFLISLSQLCITSKSNESLKNNLFMSARFFISAVMVLLGSLYFAGIQPFRAMHLLLGIGGGFLQGTLMKQTSKVLSKGHSNLGVVVLNSACVVPTFVLFLIFGESFQFQYSFWQVISTACIIFGFFLASRSSAGETISLENSSPLRSMPKKTLLITFCIQALFLVFLQWKALNFKGNIPTSPLLPFQGITWDQPWTNPIMFLVSAILQLSPSSVRIIPTIPSKEWMLYGVLGGLATGCSGLLLLYAIDQAHSPLENALLYPLLSMGTIILTQVFAFFAFREKLHWKANFCFVAGILFNGC